MDVGRLAEMARRSAAGEFYHLVSEGPGYRVGVVARGTMGGPGTFSVELLLQILVGDFGADLSGLKRALQISCEAERRGYSIVHLDDGWICCVKTVPADQVICECMDAMAAVQTLGTGVSAEAEGRRNGSE